MKSAKTGEEEGVYEKLVCDGMKSEKADAGVKLVCDSMKSEKVDAGLYSDLGEKKTRIGRIQFLFYVSGVIVLLPMSVFSLCLGAMISAADPEHRFDGFFLAMIMCFYLTSQLGGTLLCESFPSLNCSTSPELIDFGGAVACGLTTWGYYYATKLCDSIVSEGTPGRRFAAATHMMYGTYVFTIVSAVLTFGFLLRVCHQLSGSGAGDRVISQHGAGAGDRVISQRRRGTIASDMYRFLIITIIYLCYACFS